MLPSESTGPMMPNAENFGWLCVPLVADTCVAWGNEAIEAFSQLASRLATLTCMPKSAARSEIYGWLNLHLVRASAIATRCILGYVYVCTPVTCIPL